MPRQVCCISSILVLAQPIQSRFAVPPTPVKEERVNPDIKRLSPVPSYEKHRVVGGVLKWH
mgnify:FL=1